jgi:hypothetical protein
MTATPLWLALKISPGKERKAHQLFEARGIVSLYAHKLVKRKASRHAKRENTYEVPLLTGYALVAHSGRADFIAGVAGLRWPFSDVPVCSDILGRVAVSDVDRLADLSGREDQPFGAPTLRAGDVARICVGALQGREVKITVVRGNKVRVELDGRELLTTVEKLEAA